MGRGPRAKRGDVRAAALALLAQEPMNGYQIIQEIGERSDGVWRPSPGSVYPALQQLEDEGLIRAETDDSGRRSYQLTDEGRSYVEAHPDEVRAPWDAVADSLGDSAIQMRKLLMQVGMAGQAGAQRGHRRPGTAGAADPHGRAQGHVPDPRGRRRGRGRRRRRQRAWRR